MIALLVVLFITCIGWVVFMCMPDDENKSGSNSPEDV